MADKDIFVFLSDMQSPSSSSGRLNPFDREISDVDAATSNPEFTVQEAEEVSEETIASPTPCSEILENDPIGWCCYVLLNMFIYSQIYPIMYLLIYGYMVIHMAC